MEVDSDSNSDIYLSEPSDSNIYLSEPSDTEMDIDLNDLINDFKDISFFGEKQKFMELHENANLEIDEYDSDEIQEILDKTNKRYSEYLNEIEFLGDQIKNKINNFKVMFKDYSISDITLFKLMKEIDNSILDELLSSTEARFWFN